MDTAGHMQGCPGKCCKVLSIDVRCALAGTVCSACTTLHGGTLCEPQPGGPVNVCVVFDILLIAHGSFCYLFVAFLHLLLLVHHAASSGAVHALAFVHAQVPSNTWSSWPKHYCRSCPSLHTSWSQLAEAW